MITLYVKSTGLIHGSIWVGLEDMQPPSLTDDEDFNQKSSGKRNRQQNPLKEDLLCNMSTIRVQMLWGYYVFGLNVWRSQSQREKKNRWGLQEGCKFLNSEGSHLRGRAQIMLTLEKGISNNFLKFKINCQPGSQCTHQAAELSLPS